MPRWNKIITQQQDQHWNTRATELQQLNPGGPNQIQIIKPQPTFVKDFRPQPSYIDIVDLYTHFKLMITWFITTRFWI